MSLAENKREISTVHVYSLPGWGFLVAAFLETTCGLNSLCLLFSQVVAQPGRDVASGLPRHFNEVSSFFYRIQPGLWAGDTERGDSAAVGIKQGHRHTTDLGFTFAVVKGVPPVTNLLQMGHQLIKVLNRGFGVASQAVLTKIRSDFLRINIG